MALDRVHLGNNIVRRVAAKQRKDSSPSGTSGNIEQSALHRKRMGQVRTCLPLQPYEPLPFSLA